MRPITGGGPLEVDVPRYPSASERCQVPSLHLRSTSSGEDEPSPPQDLDLLSPPTDNDPGPPPSPVPRHRRGRRLGLGLRGKSQWTRLPDTDDADNDDNDNASGDIPLVVRRSRSLVVGLQRGGGPRLVGRYVRAESSSMWSDDHHPDDNGGPHHTLRIRRPPKREETDEDGTEDASLDRFWPRVTWLVVLLVIQSTTSVILQGFEGLVVHHPVVVYFLTMLVGSGGNAGTRHNAPHLLSLLPPGSQSTVLVIRAIATGQYRRRDYCNVVRQQLSIG